MILNKAKPINGNNMAALAIMAFGALAISSAQASTELPVSVTKTTLGTQVELIDWESTKVANGQKELDAIKANFCKGNEKLIFYRAADHELKTTEKWLCQPEPDLRSKEAKTATYCHFLAYAPKITNSLTVEERETGSQKLFKYVVNNNLPIPAGEMHKKHLAKYLQWATPLFNKNKEDQLLQWFKKSCL